MENQNQNESESTLEVVEERLKMIDSLIQKFSGFPDVQQTLKEARESLLESEEEIMNYYDLTDLAKTKLN
jgi:hypothetical protein